jgi:hypothetical protein
MYGEGGTEFQDAVHVRNSLVSITLDHVPGFPQNSQVLCCS